MTHDYDCPPRWRAEQEGRDVPLVEIRTTLATRFAKHVKPEDR